MERRAKVELFEQIRREYEFGLGTIKGGSEQAGSASADGATGVGQRRAAGAQAGSPRAAGDWAVQSFIDRILEADRSAPRKQRQYCASIYERIRSELPEHKVAEVTARVYVRQRKHKLGWTTRETCVPQSYAPGREGQVDWCEAWAVLQVNRSSCKCFRCAAW